MQSDNECGLHMLCNLFVQNVFKIPDTRSAACSEMINTFTYPKQKKRNEKTKQKK
jgi:hypothetical protein